MGLGPRVRPAARAFGLDGRTGQALVCGCPLPPRPARPAVLASEPACFLLLPGDRLDQALVRGCRSLLDPLGLQFLPLSPPAFFFFRATAATRRWSTRACSLIGPLGLQLAPFSSTAAWVWHWSAGARSLLGPLGLQLVPLSARASCDRHRPTAARSLCCTLLLSSSLFLALPAEVLLFLSFATLSIAAPSLSSANSWPAAQVARRHRNELRKCGS